MPKLDRAFAKELVERFGKIPPDAKPKWGKMAPDELVRHLVGTMNYSMGKQEEQHFNGNWFFVNVVGPLAVNGVLPLPKNVVFKKASGEAAPALTDEGDLETLAEAIEEFISQEESGELKTPRHAFFGDIGPEGWSKLHVVHFKHHLKQFGV